MFDVFSGAKLQQLEQTLTDQTTNVRAFWRAFREHSGIDHDDYAVVAFGDSAAVATELADLVISGRKRATAGLARDVELGGEPAPVVGGYVVLIDGAGEPQAIWRTLEVRRGRLDSVDERFAWDEGEGDQTREWWLDEHRRYFARQADRDGFDMHDGIETMFERFKVIWPIEPVRPSPRA